MFPPKNYGPRPRRVPKAPRQPWGAPMPPRSRQLWQLVAFLVIFTALGINPLAMVPLHVGAVMAIVVFGWRGPWLLRRLARRHARVQRDRSREFGPRAR